jgi:predicted lipoprotein with Yx(FWY)xxD motif
VHEAAVTRRLAYGTNEAKEKGRGSMRRLGWAVGASVTLLLWWAAGLFAVTPAAAATAPLAPVKVMVIMVNHKKTKVLTTLTGRTLYWFTPDTATKSACDNAKCDAAWPALTVKGPVKAFRTRPGIPGKFTVVKDVHGYQIAYNGHLLYTFFEDTKAGQAHGEGFLKKWWVATPTLAPLGAKTSSGSGSKSSSGWSKSATGSWG